MTNSKALVKVYGAIHQWQLIGEHVLIEYVYKGVYYTLAMPMVFMAAWFNMDFM